MIKLQSRSLIRGSGVAHACPYVAGGMHLEASHRATIASVCAVGVAMRTPSPPIESLDFRGFDSSRLLILRGGNSHVGRIL